MKISSCIILLLLLTSCAEGRDKTYVGSTPCKTVVKNFLGIPTGDSIDFVKWKLVFDENQYHLHCQFGIGKQGTNGFINGGKTVEWNGPFKKENHVYYLQYEVRKLL